MTLDKPSNKELLIVVETARSTMYGSLMEVIYTLPIHFCTMCSIHNKVHFLFQTLNIGRLCLVLDHEKNIIDLGK